MNFKQLLADDDAVSPVIGVILMVAITVILAAVIGTFVLGLGDQVQQTSPTTQLEADQGTESIDGVDWNSVTIEHTGGDGLSSDNINVTVNGATAWGYTSGSPNTTNTVWWTGQDDISAGSSIQIVAAADPQSPDTHSDIDSNGELVEDTANSNGLTITDTNLGNTYNNVQLESGDTVRVTWESGEGRSSTLLEREIN